EKRDPSKDLPKVTPPPPQPTPAPTVVGVPPASGPQSGSSSQPASPVPLSGPGAGPPPPDAPPVPRAVLLKEEPLRQVLEGKMGLPPVQRFPLTIAPTPPVKDLLPVAPKVHKPAGPPLTDDLAQVPEVDFQAPLPRGPEAGDLVERTAHTIARINHL